LKQIRKRLTYANVMSSIAVFLVLGGATAIAAQKIGKNDLKANSVTAGKIKKNAVTSAKIKNNAVTANKIANGAVTTNKIGDDAVTGAKVNESTLGTVPSAANSVTTNEVASSRGTVALGQQATVFEHGPVRVVVRCKALEGGNITAHAYIESSTDGTIFVSWADGNKNLGPATPEAERELNGSTWVDSAGPFAYDSASDVGVSATASNGQSFTAFVGLASEKDSGTCWYWSTGTIIS
jgi:hypothetical protein